MKVKLVKQHHLKADGFFEAHGGKIFDVIWARQAGYDVDLAPLGHPGKWGFMYLDEVEVVDDAPTTVEKVADVQHEIWSNWMRYLFSVCEFNPDGSYTILTHSVERWKKQIKTPYQGLSEREKEGDRAQALKVLETLRKN